MSTFIIFTNIGMKNPHLSINELKETFQLIYSMLLKIFHVQIEKKKNFPSSKVKTKKKETRKKKYIYITSIMLAPLS